MGNKTVDEYINEFASFLKQLDESERSDVSEFYREYLIDGNFTTSDAIINELGTPKHLARKVLADYSIKMSEENYQHVDSGDISDNQKMKRNANMIIMIIVAIFATPILIPVGLLLLGVAAIFFILVFFFVLVALILAATAIIVPIITIVAGLAVVFQSPMTTVLYVGSAFVVLGLDLILIPLIISLCKWLFDMLVIFFRWVGKKLLHGRKTPVKEEQDNA
ncbi:DUF1700 domain-containing protein [Companilactobacillus sp.]|uniref:DUF1700 domain-containing protein n=1 Tax=Companilactobacillus sp. TaxID=2767905 RepID=UPI002601BBB4|nr:DUF1700 domain-containing protein [Companilactobacillus sp.]